MKARAIPRPYPVALLILLILLALLGAALAADRPARAQTVQEAVFVDNFRVFPDSHGYTTLDFRVDPSVVEVWATCGGAYPEGGTSQIPSQVMARKPDPRVLRLRVFNNTGQAVTTSAGVRINCAFDIVATVPTTPASLRARLAKVLQQAG